jgi:class 3 adenylate cyclase
MAAKSLRAKWDEAYGEAQQAIVVIADIRGFSSFSQTNDVLDVATYITTVFRSLIDNYFPFAHFYKSTGDGLLIVVPGTNAVFAENLNKTVRSCLECVENFASIAAEQPLLNIATPKNIGFGISRGTVTCLKYGSAVLDYSGHKVNLAARLQDLARPKGVVIEGTVSLNILTDDLRDKFVEDSVYIRSIAETVPTRIYLQGSAVLLQAASRVPLTEDTWVKLVPREFSVKNIRTGHPRRAHIAFEPELIPRSKNDISVKLREAVDGAGDMELSHYLRPETQYWYRKEGGDHAVVLLFDKIAPTLEPGDAGSVLIEVSFVPK